jgi:carbonic anhydrase
MHIVHKDLNKNTMAVLAIFFDVAAGGSRHSDFIGSLHVDQHGYTIDKIPLMDLVKKMKKNNIYHYSGSLTAPPCSEIVTWIILDSP